MSALDQDTRPNAAIISFKYMFVTHLLKLNFHKLICGTSTTLSD